MGRRQSGVLLLSVVAALVTTPGYASAQSVEVEEGVQYGEAEGVPLLLDAYVPSDGGSDIGVIVIHGGRWMDGDRSETPADLVAAQGFVAFSVDYRLAPQYPYPAAIEDLQMAVRWVRAHADDYGIDPAKIWAMGGSAGGQLAALLGTLGEGPTDRDARVAAAVSWSGPMDLERLAETRAGLAEAATQFVGCKDPADPTCAGRLREASPITYLDPTDPPLFVANGTAEPIPFDQAQVMIDAAERAGVPHQLWPIEDDLHGFSYVREALEPTTAFVLKAIEGSGETIAAPPTPRVTETAESPRDRTEPAPSRREEGSRAGVVFGILAAVAAAVIVTLLLTRTWRGRGAW